MEGNKMFNQVVDYQKSVFDNAFTIISNAQDQSEAIVLSAIEKTPMLPKESMKLISYWGDFFKKIEVTTNPMWIPTLTASKRCAR